MYPTYSTYPHDTTVITTSPNNHFAHNRLAAKVFQLDTGELTTGYYKLTRHGILFLDLDKEPRAFLSCSSTFPFFVSAVRQSNGRIRYMYGLSPQDEAFLGLSDDYTEKRYTAHAIYEMFFDNVDYTPISKKVGYTHTAIQVQP